jgi:hypothetical protein
LPSYPEQEMAIWIEITKLEGLVYSCEKGKLVGERTPAEVPLHLRKGDEEMMVA